MKWLIGVLISLGSSAAAHDLDLSLPPIDHTSVYTIPEPDPILPQFEFQEPIAHQRVVFYTLMALDVYSTHRALKYDCIVEANPLLGKQPKLYSLILIKALPTYTELVTQPKAREYRTANFIQGVVVINNFDLLYGARKRCGKR